MLPALPRGGGEGRRDGDDMQPQPEAVLPPDGDTPVYGRPVCGVARQPQVDNVGPVRAVGGSGVG